MFNIRFVVSFLLFYTYLSYFNLFYFRRTPLSCIFFAFLCSITVFQQVTFPQYVGNDFSVPMLSMPQKNVTGEPCPVLFPQEYDRLFTH